MTLLRPGRHAAPRFRITRRKPRESTTTYQPPTEAELSVLAFLLSLGR